MTTHHNKQSDTNIQNEELAQHIQGEDKLAEDAAAESFPHVDEVWPVVEAILFGSSAPLSPKELHAAFDDGYGEPTNYEHFKSILEQVVDAWAEDAEKVIGKGFHIRLSAGKYAFRSTPNTAEYLKSFYQAKPQRLSRSALETLSIVAYRQPITRAQIDSVRGVDCGNALRTLVEKGLLRILGRADDVGKPLIYGTTNAFLDFFNLERLSDMPSLRDYEELKGLDTLRPEAVKTPDGPIEMMDLFKSGSETELVSEETENESAIALKSLEEALGHAIVVERSVTTPDNDSESETEAQA